MGKFAATAVLDAPLDIIAAATEMYYCNGQPTDRADAIAKRSANAIAMTGTDFAKTTVSTSRQLTVAAKSAAATASQNTDHVALCSASALVYVTTAPPQNSNTGSAINSAAFTITSPQVA